jgi:LemA protein
MENYPQLKSIDTVSALMAENAGTENRISVERGRYNEVVGVYQIATKRFPGGLVASIFGFGPRDMFEAATGAENAPKVDFN